MAKIANVEAIKSGIRSRRQTCDDAKQRSQRQTDARGIDKLPPTVNFFAHLLANDGADFSFKPSTARPEVSGHGAARPSRKTGRRRGGSNQDPPAPCQQLVIRP